MSQPFSSGENEHACVAVCLMLYPAEAYQQYSDTERLSILLPVNLRLTEPIKKAAQGGFVELDG